MGINRSAKFEVLGEVAFWEIVFDGKAGESRTRPETRAGGASGGQLGHQRLVTCPDIVSLLFSSYAFKISRRDSTRSINGRMPSSLEMARDSSNKDIALAGSPSALRSRRATA